MARTGRSASAAMVSRASACSAVKPPPSRPGRGPQDGIAPAVEDAALDLAEVHVVHGGDGGESFARGPVERAHGADAVEVVLGTGVEADPVSDVGTVEGDDLVVGHGRQLPG